MFTIAPSPLAWLGFAKHHPVLFTAALLVFCVPSVAPAAEDAPTHLLTGIVVDEAGSPVANATVTTERITGVLQTTTDAAGRFQLEIPLVRPGYLFAELSAETPAGLLGTIRVQQTTPEPLQLVVKPGHGLTVTVQDEAGQPIANAEAVFITGYRPFARGTTDAAGRWKRHVPPDAKDWTILAYKGGVGFDYATSARARGAIAEKHPLPHDVALKLDGARTFKVKCVDRENRPVAGVQVGTWLVQKPGYEAEVNLSLSTVQSPLTDANGLAVIDWLPAKSARSWSIKYDATKLNLNAIDHAYFIPANDPKKDLTIQLLPIEELSGRVTYPDGRPAAGIPVAVSGQGGGMNNCHTGARTAIDGTYKIRAFSQQAYVVAVTSDEWAAPYRADIIVRAGQPVTGVDFVLQKPTRVQGRVTMGKNEQPVADSYLAAVISKGQIPDEFRVPNDRIYRPVSMQFSTHTDADGHYEFLLGPGDYTLQGPARTQPVKITVPANGPAPDIVRDFSMPRAESGEFTVRVVDRDGQPMPGAMISGTYAARGAHRLFTPVKADSQGTIKAQRGLDPLVLFAITADESLAGIVRSDAEVTEAKVVVGPLASASGRLLDLDGQPLANKEITYGILIYQGEPGRSPFFTSFGGVTKTDAEGHFRAGINFVGELLGR